MEWIDFKPLANRLVCPFSQLRTKRKQHSTCTIWCGKKREQKENEREREGEGEGDAKVDKSHLFVQLTLAVESWLKQRKVMHFASTAGAVGQNNQCVI